MKQIDLFDYIEKPEPVPEPKSTLEKLFGKIRVPVTQCANCLCGRCSNNVVVSQQPDEVNLYCYECDECYYYTGERVNRRNNKEDCKHFVVSNQAAAKQRNKMKIVKQIFDRME